MCNICFSLFSPKKFFALFRQFRIDINFLLDLIVIWPETNSPKASKTWTGSGQAPDLVPGAFPWNCLSTHSSGFPLLCPDSQTKRDISAPSSCVLSRELLYRTKFRNFITALSKPWWGGSQAGNCPFPDASCFEKAGYALQVRGQPCQAPLEVQPTLPFT